MKRLDISDVESRDGRRTLIHLRGYYGDGGENEGVLSIGTELSPGTHYPTSGRIYVGSPSKSPLLAGYIPNLGFFTCGPDEADALANELLAAARMAREAMAKERP